MCTTSLGSLLSYFEHLLVFNNKLVAPVKNPSVAINTTKPFSESSFLFQSTLLSFFSFAFLPSIKIFFKGICDGQSWIYGVRSTFIGVRSTFIEVRSTFIEVRSAFIGVRSTFIEVRSTFIGVRSTFIGVRSTFIGVRGTFIGLYVLSRKE